ncbi:UDP-N-acetylmuramoyl-L-alanyl-D-glutamate--2,6-diaminopimelate ligase [Thalassotalea sp. Y01]|uniref:UDP-N-acetylmuramoyl-L-alanyl-D-glutamate--2, 6-diaminopimelate ligase n=1 Tax=Thalassotalea sp. Y01 TaxID=2729613 RepID=UPI00145CEBA8|nr:UDP-N-acetylmuramoyl-L-alanyl-D-glutamate--2,6-diaminopimelate ligase [Thalassotalea sp. Y01]NMP15771.1 UDP-N-acetylmuramoyl-L-alanyl-D-glutamate--2,6-diaminopimelate ligase [Thalassotalea sp. Y01]
MPNQSHFSINQTLLGLGIDLAATGFVDNHCRNLVNDSRQVNANDIFAAVIGTQKDAKQFIDTAVQNGAALVIYQCQQPQQHGQVTMLEGASGQVPSVAFYQLAKQLHLLAANYYNNPADTMTLVGVTGTNGKTSCCQLLAQLLSTKSNKSAIIGTLGAGTLDNLVDINNTTPGPTLLQQLLAEFTAQQVNTVAMEVSSHALHQHRLNSEMLDIAVFTNLSRDHLDYHGDMQSYADAKKAMFVANGTQKWVINADDAIGKQWLYSLPDTNPKMAFAIDADESEFAGWHYLIACDLDCHNNGIRFTLKSSFGQCQLDSPLLGEFNVANLLAVIAVALLQGITLADLPDLVANLQPVAGRMEVFSAANAPTAVVDYAHTPDGLEQALRSATAHCQGKLWAVFGCGGDRDKGKRALMGAIAEQYADHIVLTNDNPRTEQPETIAADIAKGIKAQDKTTTILDRQQAVLSTLSNASSDDMVLLAGKGHEDYLIIGEQTIAYHEREVVRQFYLQREGQ